MKKGWKKVEVDFFQEDTVPASKKRAQEFLNCSTWGAAKVHDITPWFSNVAAGLQLVFLQTGSMWCWHSWSWKILSAVSMSHHSALLPVAWLSRAAGWSSDDWRPHGRAVQC